MFNAMRYTRDLIESGFTKDQADTAIKVLLEIMENKFATRDDIALVRKDIQISELALRSDMKEMEYRLTSKIDQMVVRLSGVIVITIGVVATVMKAIV